MTKQKFIESIENSSCPHGLSLHLQSLWWDAKGEWDKAHRLIDHLEDPISAHIHAYLHRVEGDIWNARYWYNKAKKDEYCGSLKQEWELLVDMYL